MSLNNSFATNYSAVRRFAAADCIARPFSRSATSCFNVAVLAAAAILLPLVLFSSAAFAQQTLDWDANSTSGINLGGDGTWATGTPADWWNGTSDIAWTDTTGTDTAVFEGTSGIVTLDAGGVTANALIFDTSGYTLSGGPLTLANNSGSSPNPTITFNTGSSGITTISSNITAASPVMFNGTGLLNLSGSNTFSAVTLASGTVAVQGSSPLGTAPVTLSGGTLRMLAPAATPAISGFGGTSSNNTGTGTGWTANGYGNGVIPITSNVLTLTDGNGGEARTAFYSTGVAYSLGFTAAFTYTATGGTTLADGFSFMLQNSGTGAVGRRRRQHRLCRHFPEHAIAFEIYNGAPNYAGRTGFDTNGNVSENNALSSAGSVNMTNGDPINVTVAYSSTASTITETLTDATTLATESFTYTNENLSSILGNNGNALVGFSGGTGGVASTQTISNFTYTNAQLGSYSLASNNLILSSGATSTVDVTGPTNTLGTLQVNSRRYLHAQHNRVDCSARGTLRLDARQRNAQWQRQSQRRQ